MKTETVSLSWKKPERGVALLGGVFCVFLSLGIFSTDVSGQGANSRPRNSGIAGIASSEAIRRQNQVQSAQSLFTSGSKAYSDRSYGEAMDYFKAAFETTPEVPATAEMRLAFFKRYQRAALSFAEVLIDEAKWLEAEQTLNDVVSLADSGAISPRSIDPDVKKVLANLKDVDYYNMANSPRHIKNMADVKSQLIVANGYLELGEYDRAVRAYSRVLAIDPYNSAARRGMENVERQKLNYYDAARNHTRSVKMRELAKGWEIPVPNYDDPDFVIGSDTEIQSGGKQALEAKLKRIILPSIELVDARLVDAVEYLTQKSQELDITEQNPLKKGVNIVINTAGADAGVLEKTLTVSLSNVPLGAALQYTTQQVGMKYVVDNYAVSVVPLSAATDAPLLLERFPVPPGFLSSGGPSGDGAAESSDPFAEPDSNSSGTLAKRITAQQFLEQKGVTFGPGAFVRLVGSTLIVKTTPEQMHIVRGLVQGAKESGGKNVSITVKMISVKNHELKVAGLDFLMGAAGLSSDKVFFSGGTNGDSVLPAVPGDYPFPIAGMTPVTSGLRIGEFSGNQTIDSALAGAANTNGVAPGVFAVSGIFTDPQFGMVIRALNQIKGTDLLCSANVLVNPGQRARIELIREFIYPTEYDPPEIPNQVGSIIPIFGPGGTLLPSPPQGFIPVTPATPTAFEMRRLGKIVEVEPVVDANNKEISVNILADFSDFVGFVNYGTPIFGGVPSATGAPSLLTSNNILMPVFDVVRETTNVPVWDGSTIVIGGFHGEEIADVEDKIPFLGDLPVVGKTFRSTTQSSKKRALLIFVTVRLVDPGGNPINGELDNLASQ